MNVNTKVLILGVLSLVYAPVIALIGWGWGSVAIAGLLYISMKLLDAWFPEKSED